MVRSGVTGGAIGLWLMMSLGCTSTETTITSGTWLAMVNAQGADQVGLAVSSRGVVHLSGDYLQPMKIGWQALGRATDCYVARYDAATGRAVLAAGLFARSAVMASSPDGRLAIAGGHIGGTFGSVPGYNYAVYAALLDDRGSQVWARNFVTDKENVSQATSVQVDDAGGVGVLGYFQGAVSFGGPTLVPDPGDEVITLGGFAVKLDAHGEHLWSRTLPGPIVGAFEPSGGVVAAGTFATSVDLGGVPFSASDEHDAYVLKLDAEGEHAWSQHIGGPGIQRVGAIVGTPDGGAAAVVESTYDIEVGATMLDSSDELRIVVVKLGPDGELEWVLPVVNRDVPPLPEGTYITFGAGGRAASLASDGSIVIAGTYKGTLVVDGDPVATANGHDVFVLTVAPDGTYRDLTSHGGAGDQIARAVVARERDVFIAGTFDGTMVLDDLSVTSDGNTSSQDVFLARLLR